MVEPILIDGSEGEGGGQMLRSALALSLLTQQAFRLINIRAKRPKPGLAAQHLASVRAAATISNATVRGDKLSSREILFEPGSVQSGDYDFPISTAGATALVLHTVYLPLMLRGQGPSTVRITGGTHVRAAPTLDYLQYVWSSNLVRLNGRIDIKLLQTGFYPRGGGCISASIEKKAVLQGFDVDSARRICTDRTNVFGLAGVASLPKNVSERLSSRATKRLEEHDINVVFRQEQWKGGPGAAIALFLETRDSKVWAGFTALGERGKPAEAVADEAVDALLAHWNVAPTAVDPHAADQLLLPLVFAEGASRFQTSEVTQHLLTNAEIISRFVARPIFIKGELGGPGWVGIPA